MSKLGNIMCQKSELTHALGYSEPVEVEHREAEPLSRCYRDEDMEYDPGKPRAMWRGSWTARFSGWRGGVLASIVVTAFVLLLNVILVIVATTVWDPKDGIATAFTGDCTKAARWTTALHLLINLLGSLLLGASNYCMQRLVAPTRKEIDEAHAKRKWLDIGVPSIRNLSSINKGRVGLWILLGLSSLPLHLMWVFPSRPRLWANIPPAITRLSSKLLQQTT